MQSRLISKVLSPAVRLWIRSQVESIAHLEFQIQGSDRQILAGCIPGVVVTAEKAVYRGIHISQTAITAGEIRINLSQVLQGKPLRLLAKIPIAGEVQFQQDDLNLSLRSPLLSEAMRSALLPLLRSGITDPATGELWGDRLTDFQPHQVVLRGDRAILTLQLIVENRTLPFMLRTGLQMLNGSRLRFDHPESLSSPGAEQGQPLTAFETFEADLGEEVNLRELRIAEGKIFCQGQINVIPI
ncbi:MAG: DUF2993 domain-containing protein [Drouetiella hepatica Uher 2000/2452]|jgi:hypothetical protein|uniref:DUF2993 domain-containing protein n=1 Tax=Drouetiella hepatica Uher 2000/2452 TaxID=904376 RepID=A0A951USB6_9CYAN|nr:DUF2993 domain-containing protein [Drouetiella hepatica Uher 2000/2452]